MKTTSNYTEYVKKIVELMNVLDEEDKKVVVVYAGALRFAPFVLYAIAI